MTVGHPVHRYELATASDGFLEHRYSMVENPVSSSLI